jgi:hypothetical protein
MSSEEDTHSSDMDVSSGEEEETYESPSEEETVEKKPAKKKKVVVDKKKKKQQDEEEETSEEESDDSEDEEPPKKKKKKQAVDKKKKHHHHHKEEKKKKKVSKSKQRKTKKEEDKPKKPPTPYLEHSAGVRVQIAKSAQPGFVEKLTADEEKEKKKAPTATTYSMTSTTTISGGVWNLGDRDKAKAAAWVKPFLDVSAYILANKGLVSDKLFSKHREFALYVLYILGYVKYILNKGPESFTPEEIHKYVAEAGDKAVEMIPIVDSHVKQSKIQAEKDKKEKKAPAAAAPV